MQLFLPTIAFKVLLSQKMMIIETNSELRPNCDYFVLQSNYHLI